MPSARIVLKALIFVLAATCAVAALAAQGGRWSPHLDVLTHFAPHYLAVGVVALTGALFLRGGVARLTLAVLGAASAVGAMVLILPELTRPLTPKAPADAPGRIKVIQYNGGDLAGGPRRAVDWIVAQEPDILVVEEASPALRQAIADRTGLHVACGMTCQVAIFSRARPVGTERPRRGFYGLGPAIALAHFTDSRGPFTIVGLHYVWPTSVAIHRENSRRMLQILADKPHDRLILAGDFNSTPWSFGRRRDDAALGIERRTRLMFTWPARGAPGFPLLPIDHLYAGPDWRTVQVTRGPKLGGDHYPVVAILAPAR